jgi:hypothetical protein
MNADVLIGVTIITGAVMIVGHLARIARTYFLQKTIRQAIKSDSGLTPALLEKIDDQQPAGTGDDRTGLLLIAIGAALFCYGLIQGGEENIRQLSGIALFPFFVGAVLLGRSLYSDWTGRKGR